MHHDSSHSFRQTAFAALAAPAILAGLAGFAAPVAAQIAPVELHGSATLVNDYRFRGLSMSDGDPALQGALSASVPGGFFASAFASTIAHGDSRELDLSAGWTKRLPLFDLSLGATGYSFPGSGQRAYLEGFGSLRLPLGPFAATLGATLPLARQSPSRSSHYLFGRVTASVPLTPISFEASLGQERINLAPGGFGDKQNKWDWSAGFRYRLPPVTLGARYVGARIDGPLPAGNAFFRNPRSNSNVLLLSIEAGF